VACKSTGKAVTASVLTTGNGVDDNAFGGQVNGQVASERLDHGFGQANRAVVGQNAGAAGAGDVDDPAPTPRSSPERPLNTAQDGASVDIHRPIPVLVGHIQDVAGIPGPP
jgi:hypothetical protein